MPSQVEDSTGCRRSKCVRVGPHRQGGDDDLPWRRWSRRLWHRTSRTAFPRVTALREIKFYGVFVLIHPTHWLISAQATAASAASVHTSRGGRRPRRCCRAMAYLLDKVRTKPNKHTGCKMSCAVWKSPSASGLLISRGWRGRAGSGRARGTGIVRHRAGVASMKKRSKDNEAVQQETRRGVKTRSRCKGLRTTARKTIDRLDKVVKKHAQGVGAAFGDLTMPRSNQNLDSLEPQWRARRCRRKWLRRRRWTPNERRRLPLMQRRMLANFIEDAEAIVSEGFSTTTRRHWRIWSVFTRRRHARDAREERYGG